MAYASPLSMQSTFILPTSPDEQSVRAMNLRRRSDYADGRRGSGRRPPPANNDRPRRRGIARVVIGHWWGGRPVPLAGCNDYLTNPIDRRKLVEVVRAGIPTEAGTPDLNVVENRKLPSVVLGR